MKNLLFFLLLGVLLAAGCREDDVVDCDDFTNPACSNYNPCHDQKEVSAALEIYTLLGVQAMYDGFKVTGDTFTYNNTVIFETTEEEGRTYEWKIGSDDRTWNTSSVSLRFAEEDSMFIRNGIQVRLIVRKSPNIICFPDDDGVDTIQKTIYFRNRWEAAYLGKWRGTNTLAPDSVYTLEIARRTTAPNGSPISTLAGYNLVNATEQGCVQPYWIQATPSHQGLYGSANGYPVPNNTCPQFYYWLYSMGVQTIGDSIAIEWVTGSEDRHPVSFRGVRVK